MKRVFSILYLLSIPLFLSPAAGASDSAEAVWDFTSGSMLGWSAVNNLTSVSVSDGSLKAQTSGADPYFHSPTMSVPASPKHYLLIRMKCKLTSGRIDRFPYSDARIYFTTQASPTFTEDKSVGFVVYGINRWKDFVVFLGNHADWTANITQLRLDPCARTGVYMEIDKISFMQDTTGPDFILEHEWNFADGEKTRDLSPTLRLFDYRDNSSGLDRTDFFYQRVSGGLGPWVIDGVADSTPEDGFSHTFSALEAGTYNFSARLWDKAGNPTWFGRPDRWLSGIQLDPSAETQIVVDAFRNLGEVNKKALGNNVLGQQFNAITSVTGELPLNLQSRIGEMGLPLLRFACGGSSDRFRWKDCIGPIASRPNLISDICSGDTTNYGPAKFGIDEFFRYSEMYNTVPYFTILYRSSMDTQQAFEQAIQDAADFVEYCRAAPGANPNGGVDWAQVRADNGHPDPYPMTYFELGNEAWGFDVCGNVAKFISDPPGPDPASIAELTRRRARLYMMDYYYYLEAMKAVDPNVSLAACGLVSIQEGMGVGQRDEVAWDGELYAMGATYADAFQGHPYYPYSAWQTDATKVYWETMATGKQLEDVIQNRRALVRKYAPDRIGRLKTIFSEHNVNYNWIDDPPNGRINMRESRTLKAAVALADVFTVYLKNPDMIFGGAYWHLYESTVWGNLNKSGSNYWRNNSFFIFKIFNHHFGSTLLDAKVLAADTFDYTKPPGCILPPHSGVPMLSTIASSNDTGDAIYLVVINKHLSDSVTASVSLDNFVPAEASLNVDVWTFNGPSPGSYNTSSSELVKITESAATYSNDFSYNFPAHSVTSFIFTSGETPYPTPEPTNTTGVERWETEGYQ